MSCVLTKLLVDVAVLLLISSARPVSDAEDLVRQVLAAMKSDFGAESAFELGPADAAADTVVSAGVVVGRSISTALISKAAQPLEGQSPLRSLEEEPLQVASGGWKSDLLTLKADIANLVSIVKSQNSTIATLVSKVANQGSTIVNQDSTIATLVSKVANQGSTIVNQDSTIATLVSNVGSQESIILNQGFMLANQDSLIANQSFMISRQGSRIASLEIDSNFLQTSFTVPYINALAAEILLFSIRKQPRSPSSSVHFDEKFLSGPLFKQNLDHVHVYNTLRGDWGTNQSGFVSICNSIISDRNEAVHAASIDELTDRVQKVQGHIAARENQIPGVSNDTLVVYHNFTPLLQRVSVSKAAAAQAGKPYRRIQGSSSSQQSSQMRP
jgi:uncharacterized coiled-coil protein SlyX